MNALFAAYEMAFVSVPRADLRSRAKSGHKDAQALLSLRENPERTLSIIQVGITLVGAIAAAIGGAGAGETLEPLLADSLGLSEPTAEGLAVFLVVLPITFLSVVIGELVPKTLALRNPSRIVFAGAKFLFIADRFLSPVISLLEWSTKQLLSLFFHRSPSSPAPESSALEIDRFSPIHQKFILNMADIENKKIKDILLPWNQVTSIENSASLEEVNQAILSSGHTRLPVKNQELVTGILHAKEFIMFKESGETHWQSIIRPVQFIQPTDSALGTMRALQEKRNHMAIVAHPWGDILGIVTLEDILEEIVGDIFDEDDDSRLRKVYAAKVKARTTATPKKD